MIKYLRTVIREVYCCLILCKNYKTFANVFQLLILKKNTDAIQRKNKASYLKLDNLKIKRVTDR